MFIYFDLEVNLIIGLVELRSYKSTLLRKRSNMILYDTDF